MLIAKVHETCLHSQHKPSQNSTSRWQHIMFVTPASVSCEEATTNNADAILLGIVGARKTVAPKPFLEIRDIATAAKALHCYKPQNDWFCVRFVLRLCLLGFVVSGAGIELEAGSLQLHMHEPPSDPRPELDLEKIPREGVLVFRLFSVCTHIALWHLFCCRFFPKTCLWGRPQFVSTLSLAGGGRPWSWAHFRAVVQHLLARSFLLATRVEFEREPIALNFWTLLPFQRVLCSAMLWLL